MLLNKMQSIIQESPRIVRSVTANFGEYVSFWEIGVQSDHNSPKGSETEEAADSVCRIAYIQMCGENSFEVVLHNKEGDWYLCTNNDVSGALSVTIEYFKGEREYEECLLEVFPVGCNLQQLGVVVAGGEGVPKTVVGPENGHRFNEDWCHGMFVVVRTDSDGRDYPLEKFEGTPTSEEKAKKLSDHLNSEGGEFSEYFWKVVKLPYRLGRGMEDAV